MTLLLYKPWPQFLSCASLLYYIMMKKTKKSLDRLSIWWNRWLTHARLLCVWLILLSVLHHSPIVKKKTQSHCIGFPSFNARADLLESLWRRKKNTLRIGRDFNRKITQTFYMFFFCFYCIVLTARTPPMEKTSRWLSAAAFENDDVWEVRRAISSSFYRFSHVRLALSNLVDRIFMTSF